LITEIPEELAAQEDISYINFNSNKLTNLPASLFTLKNLKFLDISNNEIGTKKVQGSCLSEAIAGAVALVEFHASGNQLQELPTSIGDCTNLEILDLKDNQLKTLPDKVGNLEKLLRLNLEGNCMQEVPSCIGNLQLLKDLNLSRNKLKSVQNDCLTALKSIVMLDLHQNMFEMFDSVPKSEKLDTLSLSYNQLTELNNLANAPKVTVVDLHNNKMKELPKSLFDLAELKTLTVSNNELSDIDPHVALLPNLARLTIEGNPLRSMKPTMRNAGAAQLKKYLLSRLSDNEV
jgi:Leucine-rich repeat (LRR) protein